MIAAGLPAPIAEMNAQVLQLFAQGDPDWVIEDVLRLLGRPERAFEQSARDHASVFS